MHWTTILLSLTIILACAGVASEMNVVARLDYPRRAPRKVTNRPTMAATMPEPSSQIDLLVGEPVKNLDTSEAKDSEALRPKMMSTTPTTNSATPMNLFMMVPAFLSRALTLDHRGRFVPPVEHSH